MDKEEKYNILKEYLSKKDDTYQQELLDFCNNFQNPSECIRRMLEDYTNVYEELKTIVTRELSESNYLEIKETLSYALSLYVTYIISFVFIPFAAIVSFINIRRVHLLTSSAISKLDDTCIIEDAEEMFAILTLLPEHLLKSVLQSLKDYNKIDNNVVNKMYRSVVADDYEDFMTIIKDCNVDYYQTSKLCYLLEHMAMGYNRVIKCARDYNKLDEESISMLSSDISSNVLNQHHVFVSQNFNDDNMKYALNFGMSIKQEINHTDDLFVNAKSIFMCFLDFCNIYIENRCDYKECEQEILDSILFNRVDGLHEMINLIGNYPDEEKLKESYYNCKYHFKRLPNIEKEQICKLYEYLTQGEHFHHGNMFINAIAKSNGVKDFLFAFGFDCNLRPFDFSKMEWGLISQNGMPNRQSLFELLLLLGYSLDEIDNNGQDITGKGKKDSKYSILNHCFEGPYTDANIPNQDGSEYREALIEALKVCGIEPCTKYLDGLRKKVPKR